MEPSDYETNEEDHPLHTEALALAKKFVDDTSIDSTASELYIYPEELENKLLLEGKVVIVSVKIVEKEEKVIIN